MAGVAWPRQKGSVSSQGTGVSFQAVGSPEHHTCVGSFWPCHIGKVRTGQFISVSKQYCGRIKVPSLVAMTNPWWLQHVTLKASCCGRTLHWFSDRTRVAKNRQCQRVARLKSQPYPGRGITTLLKKFLSLFGSVEHTDGLFSDWKHMLNFTSKKRLGFTGWLYGSGGSHMQTRKIITKIGRSTRQYQSLLILLMHWGQQDFFLIWLFLVQKVKLKTRWSPERGLFFFFLILLRQLPLRVIVTKSEEIYSTG